MSLSGRLPPIMPMSSSAVWRVGGGRSPGRLRSVREISAPVARPARVWVRLSRSGSEAVRHGAGTRQLRYRHAAFNSAAYGLSIKAPEVPLMRQTQTFAKKTKKLNMIGFV